MKKAQERYIKPNIISIQIWHSFGIMQSEEELTPHDEVGDEEQLSKESDYEEGGKSTLPEFNLWD